MRLVTFEDPRQHRERVGILTNFDSNQRIIDASYAHSVMIKSEGRSASPLPADMIELLRSWKASLRALRAAERFALEIGPNRLKGLRDNKGVFKVDEVKFKAPVPRPGKIIHTAGNFREHAKEGENSKWEFPMPHWISFLKSPSAIVGHGDKIIRPRYTKQLDHEIELAIIIGKGGKHLKKDEAWDAVAGFTVFNDITARDIQREEMKSGLLNFGKNMDTFAPFGPCLVPRDDIGDVHDLKIECRVNGEPRQASNTSHLSVTIPEIVEHYSWVTLYPGDILTTGTVSGVAAFRRNPEKYWLVSGDVLESEIENIGVLRNTVVDDKEKY